jgi:hypothetical protein
VDPTGLGDFGYDSGRNYTLEQFRQMADRFEALRTKGMSITEKEKEYWKIITSGNVRFGIISFFFKRGAGHVR